MLIQDSRLDLFLLPGVACDVVPLDAVTVAVVEDGEAGLVVPLLQVLHGEAAVVLHVLQRARLVALEVVGLRPLQLAGVRPGKVIKVSTRLRGCTIRPKR